HPAPPSLPTRRSSDLLQEFAVPTTDGAGIRSSGLSSAFEGNAQHVYDNACDCVEDTETGETYHADDQRGAFYDEDGQRLAQGWQDRKSTRLNSSHVSI